MLDNEGIHQKQTENVTLHTSIHYCTSVAMTQLFIIPLKLSNLGDLLSGKSENVGG